MSIEITAKQIEVAFQGGLASQPASDRLVDKFQDLMRQSRMEPPVNKDTELQQSVTDAAALELRAPSLSANEMTAATIRMTLELASTQLDMEAKMGVVNSSKMAIETLMKNQ